MSINCYVSRKQLLKITEKNTNWMVWTWSKDKINVILAHSIGKILTDVLVSYINIFELKLVFETKTNKLITDVTSGNLLYYWTARVLLHTKFNTLFYFPIAIRKFTSATLCLLNLHEVCPLCFTCRNLAKVLQIPARCKKFHKYLIEPRVENLISE